MRRFLTILISVLFLLPWHAFCQERDQTSEPVVEVRAPESYILKKIAFFPVELPVYAFKAALWPIVEGTSYLERRHVFDRMGDFLSNEAKTFWVYPVIDWGAGSNFGGGLGVKHIDLFNEKYILNAEYTVNISLNQFAKMSLAKDDVLTLLGRPLSFWTEVQWNRVLDADYYGKGSGTPQSDRSRYRIADIDWDGQLYYDIGWNAHLEGRLGVATATTGPSTKGGYPAVDTTFGAGNLPGFERWLTYLRVGLGVAHDTRDNKMRPQSGGRRSVKFNRYQCLSSDRFSFNEYIFDFWQYFPLWKPGLIFAVHNNWTFQQEIGNRLIPFYRLALLDYKSPLRGFRRGRFRDRSSALFNFEYLFPVSRLIGGILFVDTGRVFDGIGDFSFKKWKYSVGGGVDLHLFRVTLIKFRMAYGGEGINFMVGMTKEI